MAKEEDKYYILAGRLYKTKKAAMDSGYYADNQLYSILKSKLEIEDMLTIEDTIAGVGKLIGLDRLHGKPWSNLNTSVKMRWAKGDTTNWPQTHITTKKQIEELYIKHWNILANSFFKDYFSLIIDKTEEYAIYNYTTHTYDKTGYRVVLKLQLHKNLTEDEINKVISLYRITKTR